jgi:hypothetical protein
VVMPIHIHGIIEIIDKNPTVGANHDSPLRNKMGINNSFYKSKFESPSNNIGWGYKSYIKNRSLDNPRDVDGTPRKKITPTFLQNPVSPTGTLLYQNAHMQLLVCKLVVLNQTG